MTQDIELVIADLFCGAGGTSTGAIEAATDLGYKPRLTAINHWPLAVDSHKKNHPDARHLCESLDNLNPRQLFKPGELDLLWASPECINHSNARGDKAINDQSRATAWCVARWAEALLPGVVLVENVPNFLNWGPLDDKLKPIKKRQGETFRAWVAVLESLGYKVAYRKLLTANYGDPTKRLRLFVQAVRGNRQIVWPDPTHAPAAEARAKGLSRWVGADTCIDLSRMGQSIFDRKKKLVPNTLRRIAAGFEKFGLTPHVYSMEHGGRSRDIQQPMITLTATPAHALVSPWIVELRGTGGAQLDSTAFDIREPLGTVTAGGVHHWLAHSTVREIQCQPYLLPQHSGATGRPVAEPASTVATAGAIALISPSLREVGDLIKAGKKPRFMVDGRLWELDVRYRMLDPKELAKIQGFRDGYFFGGKRNDQIRQIGNAVPRNTARALVRAVLSQSSK